MDLNKFLVKAKTSTYASAKGGNKKVLDDGAKEMIFEEGNLKYRDRYYGFDPFIGEEVVFEDGEAIWSMNYYGKTTSKDIPAEQVYEFLKEALRQITKDKPFRGPDNFKKGELEYINESRGDFKDFSGTERILFRCKEVYRLEYHGCMVRNK